MKEMRTAKNQAEAELKHTRRDLGLAREQIKDLEQQVSELSTSLTQYTKQLAGISQLVTPTVCSLLPCRA